MQPNGPKNRLLSALPAEEFRRLAPHLRTIPCRARQVLQKQGDPIRDVYFPNSGVYAMVATLSSGVMVEVAAIGDEGMIGVEAFFTEDAVAPGERLAQTDGDAERLAVADFRCELAKAGALHEVVGRYAHAKTAEFVQTAACNASHSVQERCARWLLETHDRLHRNAFELSHEFLAMMLGANRSTVSVVAGALQSAGFIRYRRGHIEVIDREGLEAAACECYLLIRAGFDRFGPPKSPNDGKHSD